MSLKSFAKKYLPHLFIIIYNHEFGKRIKTNKARAALSHEERIAAMKEKYNRKVGRPLNIDNPQTFTEKIQWLKLYDSTKEKADWTDKIKAKELAAELIGEKHIVKTLHKGVKSLDDIDFSILPDRFVIKTNHGSGCNMIVKDKNKFLKSSDYILARNRFNNFLQLDFGFDDAFELHYSMIEPLIFVEEYIEPEAKNYVEYTFLCFHGNPEYIRVKTVDGADYMNIYDINWNDTGVWFGHDTYPTVKKPDNLDELIELAEKLCGDFAHVRVDFNVNRGNVYFGELTFTGGSGIFRIEPYEFDKKLGDLIKLPK
ncbi:MAG: glycosyl transferase [Clostridia bacterium]|nr:glycosyl transferase [Clostridia bacterium]